ncbi:hypothetical protein [Brachyspira pilosicoli]|uniref:Lipocalin-like domain-containing protein n=1 Tax=Brachyspira pilosicoli TaxID=52584 RepID=A0A5C8EFV4_BRAPL|nr:hypothetical protein [Brachyspira pilosicoli]TXJ36358.1 hypothetical protein EPJ72_11715 [Brachyspira pilosicoli]
MSKKILSLVLFLVSALAVSCSNADKTGSGDNNSGSTTPQGIAKYEGTWQLTDLVPTTILTISNNGAVTYNGETSTNVANNRNETYEVKFVDKDHPAGPGGILTLTLKFNDDTSGTFSNSDGLKSTIKKQKK